MSCVNWNRRYLQDLSAIEQHQDFQDKRNITELHLSFNFITELPQGTLVGFNALTVLSLACNCLTGIPAELKCVPALTELHLSNNQIRVIENLEALVGLKHLNLRCNKIRCISNLNANVSLQWLTLSNNEIVSVRWDQLSQLKHLTFLGLYNNQLIGMAPLLREAFLGGNPFSDGLPLTVTSAVTCLSGHLDETDACKFVSLLRKRQQQMNTACAGVTPISDVAASLSHGQTDSKALQRLLLVVDRLEQIRLASPTLLIVDGERLVL